jgi:cobalt/nickel transport system ATP-binding protein
MRKGRLTILASVRKSGKWSLIDLLRSLPVTRLIASHDLDLVKCLCDRVVVLNAGKIVADGRTGDILGDEALLEANGLTGNGHKP